jgi:DNA polymerase III subunit alpha
MFINLHNHSEYSLLDGLSSPIDMAKKAKSLHQNAIAITDHGNMFGVIEFYKACKSEGVKPILGVEAYVNPDIDPEKNKTSGRTRYHLCLYAKNYKGYQSLCNIVSQAYLKGFYYKPRIDFNLLSSLAEDIVVSSGCIQGEIPKLILEGRQEEAEKIARQYKERFGDDFYIELMNHNIPEELEAIPKLIQVAKKYNIKLIATNDSHYVHKSDAHAHDVLLCIQQLKKFSDTNRMKFYNDSFYLKSEKEMLYLFKGIEEAVHNTEEIANKCNVEIDFTQRHIPKFKQDGIITESDSIQYMKQLVKDGLHYRYGNKITQEIIDRTKYELKVIHDMQFIDYFLIVHDIVHYAKNSNISVGIGRGSACGSLVSYLLNITNADPLQYGLYFERFLNPGRNSMPDIDLDFEDQRRENVFDYVKQKYGESCVSQIGTFGRLESKAAFRDVARAFDISAKDFNIYSKQIPSGLSLNKAYEESSGFAKLINSSQQYRNIFDIALQVEHKVRNFSTHACGVLITSKEIWNYLPLAIDKNKKSVSMFEKDTVEELGLLKMDFLGLKNLSTVSECKSIIKQTRNLDVKDITLNNKKTYELYQKGQTKGVFQVESAGMRKWLKELKPDNIEDIISMVALYRPGPMQYIKDFIENKKNPNNSKVKDKKLKKILKNTYEILIYQESVMAIAKEMAGFSLSEADDLRKAIGKKKADLMEQQKDKFISGMIKNGYKRDFAEKMFEDIEKFASYSFNRSHAVGYGLLSYETAYLKANYTTEYMCALLNTVAGDQTKTEDYIIDCRQFNIQVKGIDINKSLHTCSVEKNRVIQSGFNLVKGIMTKDVDKIIKDRERNGQFVSLVDFIARCGSGLNKKTKENLSKAGAFDEFDKDRSSVVEYLKPKKLQGESFFMQEEQTSNNKKNKKNNFNFLHEKEAYGFYFSEHPMSYFNDIYTKTNIYSIEDVKHAENTSYMQLFCLVDDITQNKHTKKGKIVTLSDTSGTEDLFCFNDQVEQIEEIIQTYYKEEAIGFLLTVKISFNGEYVNKSIQSIDKYYLFSNAIKEFSKDADLHIHLNIDNMEDTQITEVCSILRRNKGRNKVFFGITYKNIEMKTQESEFCIEKNIVLSQQLKQVVGTENVKWI